MRIIYKTQTRKEVFNETRRIIYSITVHDFFSSILSEKRERGIITGKNSGGTGDKIG